MRFRYPSLLLSKLWKPADFTQIAVFLLSLGIAMQASAVLLFHDDFEKDSIGEEPSKWEVGHDGSTTAEVVADPKKASNKVLLTADKGSNASRHDVGGSIYVVGDAGWGDYVAEWDMMFPDDFYMGWSSDFKMAKSSI